MSLLSEYLRVPLSNIPVNTRQRDHTTLVRGASQENIDPARDTHTLHAHLALLLSKLAALHEP
jgi:hypothetical protein